ncbi:MAG: hypothetical protein NC307_12155 [Roseburia sp.]|nr:hypothetical protein [Roseburia sp.]
MKNKIIPILLMISMLICLIGCGSAAPATEEDVAKNTETTMEFSEEITTTEVENKEGVVAGTDKPAESTTSPSASSEVSPTVKPTAEPTASPEPTATPEPTAPPHVHDYAESITKQPSCAEDGVKTLTCSCGDVKAEAIPATGHDFVTQYTTIEHEALGHVEQVQVQVGTGEARHEYECNYCKARFDSPSGVVDHQKANMADGMDHAFARTIIYDYPGEPIYETQSSWIVDTPAWTEQVPNGSVCSKCGVAGP